MCKKAAAGVWSGSFEKQAAAWHKRHALRPELLPERLLRFSQSVWYHYWRAVEQHTLGRDNQYRKFGVGASAMTFTDRCHILNGQVGRYGGHNRKLWQGDPDKHCAEHMLFERATRAGVTQVVGLVVVGPYQPDDTSGHECTTLHPCVLCRNMMSSHPLTWKDMPILTALPPPSDLDVNDAEVLDRWEPTHEWHTLAEILTIHDKTRSDI